MKKADLKELLVSKGLSEAEINEIMKGGGESERMKELRALLDEGPVVIEDLVAQGWVSRGNVSSYLTYIRKEGREIVKVEGGYWDLNVFLKKRGKNK